MYIVERAAGSRVETTSRHPCFAFLLPPHFKAFPSQSSHNLTGGSLDYLSIYCFAEGALYLPPPGDLHPTPNPSEMEFYISTEGTLSIPLPGDFHPPIQSIQKCMLIITIFLQNDNDSLTRAANNFKYFAIFSTQKGVLLIPYHIGKDKLFPQRKILSGN